MNDIMWYESTSENWMEGLPIGNGRLAGMLCGAESKDILYLNHEWLWRGENRYRDNIQASHMLQPVREFLLNGDFFRGTLLANTFFGGFGGGIGIPNRIDAYQPAGELKINFLNVKGFLKRSLDIKNGVAKTVRETKESTVNTTFIAHPMLNNIVCHLEGDVSVSLSYSRIYDENAVERCVITDKKITYSCKFNGGIEFVTEVFYITDGSIKVYDNSVEIIGGSYLTIFVNIATEIKGISEELEMFAPPLSMTWSEIIDSHSAKFSEIMNRFSFDVECEECDFPTDKRIKNIKDGQVDKELAFLYFNYGRYLLVSSSICAELPANLQGKWNAKIKPPWSSDYHFDINLQMNYWMAEQSNLSECVKPLLNYCERFVPHAKKAAKDLYGCRGIVIPLSSDAWGRATSESFGYAVWIGAAPWIAQHFWWHYIYSQDTEFLKEHAYPFFKEIANFYEDYLIKDKNGIYQILPSQSPENRFEGTGNFLPVSLGISSAMDVQLAYDLLGYTVKSAELLEVDEAERKIWNDLRNNLPPFKIGSDGRLLEWDAERAETEPGHRHLSNLYGVYPSDIFNKEKRPKEFAAAEKSFDFRMENGGGHTGWSRAWCASLCARFGRKNDVFKHINEMIKEFATITLLDLHPPGIFQIDGNLGAVAAMIEAVAQFVDGKLCLLRAMPDEWENGKIKNLRVPGGHEISFEWKNGQVIHLDIKIGKEEQMTIVIADCEFTVCGKYGEIKRLDFDN